MCYLYFVSVIPCDSVSQAIAHLTDTPAEISLAQAKSRNTRSTHSGTERNKLHRNLGNVCVDEKQRDAAEERRLDEMGSSGWIVTEVVPRGAGLCTPLPVSPLSFPTFHYGFHFFDKDIILDQWYQGGTAKAYICQSIFFLNKLNLI